MYMSGRLGLSSPEKGEAKRQTVDGKQKEVPSSASDTGKMSGRTQNCTKKAGHLKVFLYCVGGQRLKQAS